MVESDGTGAEDLALGPVILSRNGVNLNGPYEFPLIWTGVEEGELTLSQSIRRVRDTTLDRILSRLGLNAGDSLAKKHRRLHTYLGLHL